VHEKKGVYGVAMFVVPGASPRRRAAFAPLHRFAGMLTYGVALATAATGLQEKADMLKAGQMGYTPGPYSAALRIPAAMQLLLVAVGGGVYWNLFTGGSGGAGRVAGSGASAGADAGPSSSGDGDSTAGEPLLGAA
jgi:hypothetical protein